eukprot:TRINITY_DN1716_c0_g1_i3.p1 TRINITY_DN1716_c0_g1~~TRINITY_DN1716_c0_g1_i3.p1  ORF type:complete len:205 (+),score=36.54 TRINITY_DN1716_c0_g1_i3:13-627(+)
MLSRASLKSTFSRTSLRALLSTSELAGIDVSKLVVKRTESPKPKVPHEKLVFGRTFTDHMLEVDWDASVGWKAPVISPYHPLQLDPAVSSLHYALQAFEGMKAYIDQDGNVRLFRPDMNMKRLNNSCKRLCFPTFDGDQYLECIKELIKIDRDWIPNKEGYSLYIRPTIISTYVNALSHFWLELAFCVELHQFSLIWELDLQSK